MWTSVSPLREVQLQMPDMLEKPEAIRPKIVQGRLDKMVNEKALLKQDFIKVRTDGCCSPCPPTFRHPSFFSRMAPYDVACSLQLMDSARQHA